MFSKRFEMIGKIGGGIKIKNIFEINTTNQTINGITKTFRDNGLYITGKTTSVSGSTIGRVELKANHTYFVCNLVNDLNNKIYYRFGNSYYGSQYHAYRFTQASDLKTNCTFNITDTTFDCDFFVRPVVIDLTASKLDLLSVKELYNLLTLGGTDFANFERLANGEVVKLDKMSLINNLLKGTRYGIVDLGSLDWTNAGTYAVSSVLDKPKTPTSDGIAFKGFTEKYPITSRWATKDNSIQMLNSGGLIFMQGNTNILEGKTDQQLKEMFSGQYLIYEQDISYTHLDLLANGQATLGLTSLLGKQNIKETLTGTKRDFILGQNTNNTFYLSQGVNDSNKILSIVQGHKYFAIARVKNVISGYTNIRHWLWNLDTNTYSLVSATQDGDNYYGIINASFSGDRVVNTFAMNYASTISGTINPEYMVLIDLTASGLDNLTAQQVYDMLNVDLSTRYGNVDLGTLNWWLDGTNSFKAPLTTIKNYSTSETPNMSCDEYTTKAYYEMGSATMSISSSSNYIWVKDSRYNDLATFINAMSGVNLKYELADQYADELTAEELYYLLAGNYTETLPTNMKLAKGITIETLNNVFKDTEYGIVNLGDLSWTYQSANKRFYTYGLQNLIKTTAQSVLPNMFCSNYALATWNNKAEGKISLNNDGMLMIYDSKYDNSTFTTAMNNVYLVYELATPQGYKYQDLYARNLCELANSNGYETLANGCRIGNYYSLLGKQNTMFNPTDANSTALYFTTDYVVRTGNVNSNRFTCISNHKYLFIAKCNLDTNRTENGTIRTYDCARAKVVSNGITPIEIEKGVYGGIFTQNETSTELAINWYRSSAYQGTNWNTKDYVYSAILIDLTELNIDSQNAVNTYNQLKNRNIIKLLANGSIIVGGK